MNEHELDARLERELRQAFAPPPAHTFAAAAARVAASKPRRWPWLVAAAAVVAIAAVAWLQRPRHEPAPSGRELGAMWVAAYEHALSEGFAGDSCCDRDVDLRRACEERFAARLDLSPSAVQLLGCYCGLPTGGCMALLTLHGGTPVSVFVLPRAEDPGPQLPPDTRFDLARREVGDLVLYALSESKSAATLVEFVGP